MCLILLSSPHTRAAAQQDETRTGIIMGRVKDAVTDGAVVAASVRLEGTARGDVADQDGRFEIRDVPVGSYSLRVSAIGFEARILTDIVVSSVHPAEVMAILRPVVIEGAELTVRPDYFPKATQAQVSTQSQSYEEIRRLPGGFEDVVRAVSIQPGVAQAEPGRNDLVVRGGAPSENLYVLDHLEVANINHFGTQGASGGPISMVNLDFVDGTTFSTGGFGVRHGDRLSSVLTVDLRRGRSDRLGGQATVSASQFGLNLEGPLGNRGAFLASARRSYLDLFFQAAGFSFVPEYSDLLVKADYRLDPGNTLTALGLGAIDNVRQFNDDADDRYDNSQILLNNQDQLIAAASWRHQFASGYTEVTLGQSLVEFEYRQNDSLLNPVFLNTSREQEFSLRGDLTWQATPRGSFTAGVQGRYIDFAADVLIPPYTSSFGTFVEVDETYDTTGYKASAYAQWSHVLDRLTATVGVRADYFSLIGDPFAFAPRLALAYRAGERTTLSAAVGRYYQSPSYIWLVADSTNLELDLIRAQHYIAGLERIVRDDLRVRVEGYLKEYFDYPASTTQTFLVMANTGSGYTGQDQGYSSFGLEPLVAAGRGRAHGVELSAQKKLSDLRWYGTLALSYNVAEYTALDGVTRPGSYDQTWIFNVGGGYLPDERWEFSGKFRFASGAPYTPYESDGSQQPSRYNSGRLASNHSLDLRVDRRWNFARWRLITYLDVQNVYSYSFNSVPTWNEREQRPEVNESIGVLPTLGIIAQF
jgi:hypothetical protein